MDICRDTFGLFEPSVFQVWTCTLCYVYLFQNGDLRSSSNRSNPGLYSRDQSNGDLLQFESDDQVCYRLGLDDCIRWQDCCHAARTCCERQMATPRTLNNTNYCPRTWDGWSCFDDTLPGNNVYKSCPKYIPYSSMQGHVDKKCTENGTWQLHPSSKHEWTDYGKCVNIKYVKGVVYASVAANSFSLILLLPSTIVFLLFRQLRSQQRIKLHVCVFSSFMVTSVLSLVWELFVYNDRVEHPWKDSFMVQHEDGCKVINILLRYATSANFFWMFCEGFYLFRLLVHAFHVPKRINIYFFIGWVGPIVPILAYSVFRWKFANDTCWVKNAGPLEWIVYTPNLLSILANLMFLVGILRILLTQLHHHPNEPSNYRRAMKATFILVPLFGLQLFLVIYRPTADSSIQSTYEIVSKVVIDSQGGLIALVFCYFNKEVLTCIKSYIQKLSLRRGKMTATMLSNYTVVSQKSVGANAVNDNTTQNDI